MKASTAIGLAICLGALALGATLEGTSVFGLLNLPAGLIVLGGTFGATFAGSTVEQMKKIPMLYKRAMGGDRPDLSAQLETLVGFAERARREGLLALDDEVAELDDEFTRKGLQLVVDGTDPELVREILENEIDGMAARHHAATQPFEKAGGLSPTMGIIGTVMGLISVLKNLNDPGSLGPSISVAFIATLYGVGCANAVFLPVATKLKLLSSNEQELRTMTLEGILAIQAGDNPRVVADKLLSFIPPDERAAEGEEGDEVPLSVPDPEPAVA